MTDCEPERSKYKTEIEAPEHLSVGAVVFDGHGNVLARYFENDFHGFSDFYLLMRETMRNGEPLEKAVRRGCLEEFGARVDVVDYLGSRFIPDAIRFEDNHVFPKTTIYFLCEFKGFDLTRMESDDEVASSRLVVVEPEILIGRMAAGFERFKHADYDESDIVRRGLVAFRQRQILLQRQQGEGYGHDSMVAQEPRSRVAVDAGTGRNYQPQGA